MVSVLVLVVVSPVLLALPDVRRTTAVPRPFHGGTLLCLFNTGGNSKATISVGTSVRALDFFGPLEATHLPALVGTRTDPPDMRRCSLAMGHGSYAPGIRATMPAFLRSCRHRQQGCQANGENPDE